MAPGISIARRRPWLGSLAGVVLCVATSASAGPSPKKGVGAWAFTGDTAALTAVGASWFYTWSTSNGGIAAPAGVSFVPMIWGSGSVTTSTLNTAKTEGSVLLGFNEPDNSGQSNMTAAQALTLWPQLVATGMRLGSPAVAANAQVAGGWLDTFMTGAKTQNLRVDFICLHWYGGNFNTTMAVSELQTYIEETHTKYNLPIWVTEYALTNFGGGTEFPTDDQQAAFAAASVTMLEATSYVERYAWFALPTCSANGGTCAAGANTGLAVAGGTLTPVGIAYAGGGSDAGANTADGGQVTTAADGGQGTTSGDSGPGTTSGEPGDSGSLGTTNAQADDGGAGGAVGSSSGGTSGTGTTGASSDGGAASTTSSKSGCQCEMPGHRGRGAGGSPGGIAAMAAMALSLLARRTRSSPRSRPTEIR